MIAGKRERVTSGISDKREPELASCPPTFLPQRESMEQARETLKKKQIGKEAGERGNWEAGMRESKEAGSGEVGRWGDGEANTKQGRCGK